MSDPFKERPFPKGALIGAALLVGFSLAVTAGARISGMDISSVPASAAPVQSRVLAFEDSADGAVIIRDFGSGQVIEAMPAGTNGFVRAVLRGFARERRAMNVGAAPPFELILWDDGRLSLFDPETGRSAQMNAFGPTNLEAFAHLLTVGEGTR